MGRDSAWVSSDPLGEALHFLRMSGTFYCHSRLGAPWGMAMPAIPRSLMFHIVLEGEGMVQVPDQAPQRLLPGELLLVPHGRGHLLFDREGVACPSILELEREHVSSRYERLSYGGAGAKTRMICGAVQFDHPAAAQLVRLLPPMIHVAHWPEPVRAWIDASIRFITLEAQDPQPGGESVMTRLADILVVQAIRAWLTSSPAGQTGWLGALHDERIGRAISAIHQDPGGDWTVDSLASHCAMSRSAFAARFTQLVGESPARYLANWRMQVACVALRDGASVGSLAQQLGYASQAAFSRAFKRFIGVSPSVIAAESSFADDHEPPASPHG